MKKYTCPMHPEIKSSNNIRCPKCGMELVDENEIKNISIQNMGLEKTTWKSYLPLFVVVGIIILTTGVLTLNDLALGLYTPVKSISYFMAGFFLSFAGFKLMDLKGFAQGYFTYDLLAKRWFGYGYIYPFIELFFGLAMIALPHSRWLLLSELLVMGFSGLGVAIKVLKKEKFQCVCLGTFLKVPLSTVTLIEDFGMAALAAILLLLNP